MGIQTEERRARHRDAQRRYCAAHPERVRRRKRETQRRYCKAHPERRREQARRYRETHRDGIREIDRSYRVREGVRERRREARRAWRRDNQDKVKAYNAERRIRAEGRGGSFTADDVGRMRKQQKNRCWWCRKPMKDKYTVDHRIALARGGGNDPSNLVLCCVSCNSRKQTKTPEEFMGRLL